MKCFCCGFEVEPLYESTDEKGMWNNGIVDKISANYGSKFDGESFLIAICDNCIESRNQRLNPIGNYMES